MSSSPEPESLADHIARLIAIEQGADLIQGWHPTLVPGMLQSPDYARAAIVASAPALPPHDVAAITDARLVRVDTLGQGPGRRARFVIAEEVLTRPVGGPAVLADQLQHILNTLALRPSMTLRVLPAGSNTHAALAGEFTMYTTAGRRAVFVENLMGGTVLDLPERTLVYADACDHLEQRAASPADSLTMVREARSRVATG
ncbi:DUF5753 domain-containing protein [Streptomyces sp. NPDC058653]|uniref:DUF5753 domain-containing protein n=1 Tax=Streptomyces sp. NPDC058653 TaxID=3346576 RepID=UPI0036487C82